MNLSSCTSKVISSHRIQHFLSYKGYEKCATVKFGTNVQSANSSNQTLESIKQKIRGHGPITVADFMRMGVSQPSVGYYKRVLPEDHPIFGKRSNLLTALEVNKMFGDMIARWCRSELSLSENWGEWQLVQFGPGTGQLMQNILRNLNTYMNRYCSIHLVEVSDALIAQQERLLCKIRSDFLRGQLYVKFNITECGLPIYWYRSHDKLPARFSIFLANEFFNALPIHQFKRDKDNEWREIYVGIDDQDSLRFVPSKDENMRTIELLPKKIRYDEERKIWEVSTEAGTYVKQIAERVNKYGGMGLIIDFGHEGHNSTFSMRAYKDRKIVDPLENLERQEVTADVDFGYLSSLIARQAFVFGPLDQKNFVENMSLGYELNRALQSTVHKRARGALIDSYRFLMSDEISLRFKMMSIFPLSSYNALVERHGPSGFDRYHSKAVLRNFKTFNPTDDFD